MTEAEWLTATDLTPKLEFLLRGEASERKLRLWAVACCRRVWHLTHERDQRVVELAEQFADSLVAAAEVAREVKASEKVVLPGNNFLGRRYAWAAAGRSIQRGVPLIASGPYHPAHLRMLLRDVFGNPFRPVAFSPEWRTDTAVTLARQMYEAREFGVMPILADALQDAGCDSEEILSHCRDPKQVHVRGCWVVDLVLGKE
jgi:hypothetical protein